jgi:hypothetical protein
MRLRRLWTVGSGLPIAVLLVATVIALGGCASPSQDRSTTPATPATFGQSIDQLDRLVVQRTNAFPSNHVRFKFPTTVSVTDPTAVQAVARALLALPKIPAGAIYNGPLDLGITYQLVFFAADRRFPAVNVDATGMETVTGLGADRMAIDKPSFWHTLGVAMGLAQPDQSTFAGSL